jgi:hypothetical protein
MSWQINGTYYAPRSCRVGCPCALGETEADSGWCSGALVFDIRTGNSNGTDVSRTKVALAGDWPSGFLAGNGTGRLYFDPGVSMQQRAELEAIVGGKRGGVFEVIGSLVPKILASNEAPISIQAGADDIRITVGGFGDLTVKPLRGPSGEYTRLLHAAAGFRDDVVLANGTGSRWRYPELRQWESAGHAEMANFEWSG